MVIPIMMENGVRLLVAIAQFSVHIDLWKQDAWIIISMNDKSLVY